MPRPKKWRRICSLPAVNAFGPVDINNNVGENVQMTLEEFETIRLIDYEGLNQEQCAEIMGVARSTIQRIYDTARRKIADSLVNGKNLSIQGGNYRLCSEIKDIEICNHCFRKRYRGRGST